MVVPSQPLRTHARADGVPSVKSRLVLGLSDEKDASRLHAVCVLNFSSLFDPFSLSFASTFSLLSVYSPKSVQCASFLKNTSSVCGGGGGAGPVAAAAAAFYIEK